MATKSEIQYQLAHIHDDRASAIVVSHAVVLPLAVIAVILRFISRRLCRARIGADDYMIVTALLFAIGEATGGFLCESRSASGKMPIDTDLLRNTRRRQWRRETCHHGERSD